MPDGSTSLMEGKPVKVVLPENNATATSIELFMNIKFETEGTYWVEIILDGDLKIRYPLRAGLLPPDKMPPPGSVKN